ncbi:hypothetical protein ACFXD5_06700 [Streptomyces sp. NPDC059385]|uniref:hypothetical protein n=1 Tax=Streptomyces sp. NPDC059385 TaxID=3346817 RepID=UPI0036859762
MRAAAARLRTGTPAAYRASATRATQWVAAGRRDDLEGWAAALGCWLRMAVLAAAGYGALWLAHRWPPLMWAVALVGLTVAWRAGAPATTPTPVEAEEADPAAPVRALLAQLMGDAPGVHLRDVLAHLQKQGHHTSWTVTELRQHIEALGIATDPKLKLGGTPTRGVRREALQPTPQPAAQDASPVPSPAV